MSAIRRKHLLEEDPFVRGVLVDQDQALGAFRDDVKISHASKHAQAEPVGDQRLGPGRGDARLDFQRKNGMNRLVARKIGGGRNVDRVWRSLSFSRPGRNAANESWADGRVSILIPEWLVSCLVSLRSAQDDAVGRVQAVNATVGASGESKPRGGRAGDIPAASSVTALTS